MHEISEENLWLLCLKGDRQAFKEMYCRFYSLLYHYGLKLVSDEELVKDCIQDIFIKIIQILRLKGSEQQAVGFNGISVDFEICVHKKTPFDWFL